MNENSNIYIEIDGQKLFSMRISSTKCLVDLRTRLTQEYHLPSGVYFLDSHGYSIIRQDETLVLISEVMDEQRTVQLSKKSIMIEQSEQACGTGNTNKVFSILELIWYPIKTLIILSIIALCFYYCYFKMVCVIIPPSSIIAMYCPTVNTNLIAVPSVCDLADNSVSLADILITADFSAPMRLIKGKSSLIDFRSRIIYSNIDSSVRLQLGEELGKLNQLTQTGADHLTDMLASYDGTLDRLRIYTQDLLDGVSKIVDKRTVVHDNEIPHFRKKMIDLSERYLALVSAQADSTLKKAQHAHETLLLMRTKLETIQELSFKGKFIIQEKMDELEHRSFWSRLFNHGEIDIAKNKRNLEILEDFSNFIDKAANSTAKLVMKLKKFRSYAVDLKSIIVLHEQLPRIPITRQKELLHAAVKQLIKSKQQLSNKRHQEEMKEDN